MENLDDLDQELERHRQLARALTEGIVLGMGAGACTIPVWIADERYEVTVRHIPVVPELGDK